jgi:hypothetical protein
VRVAAITVMPLAISFGASAFANSPTVELEVPGVDGYGRGAAMPASQ